jgi:hypothetical protein
VFKGNRIVGLFQINEINWKPIGCNDASGEKFCDPYENTLCAIKIYKEK